MRENISVALIYLTDLNCQIRVSEYSYFLYFCIPSGLMCSYSADDGTRQQKRQGKVLNGLVTLSLYFPQVFPYCANARFKRFWDISRWEENFF